MSKTVKTVMTVTMIGLVALLGAKAEAHTRWTPSGRPYSCMTCDKAELEEVPADLAKAGILVAEFIVEAKTAKIMCEFGPDVDLKAERDGVMILISEMPSNLWKYLPDPDGTAFGKALVNFQTVPELFGRLGFCGGTVKDARIFKMDATYNVYERYMYKSEIIPECKDPGCSNRILLDTVKRTDCTVRPTDPDGTNYKCAPLDDRLIDHHPTPTK